MLNGAARSAVLVASPIAGVFADRMDRRQLMLVCECFLALLTLLMGVVVASGKLAVWHLFTFTLLTGIAWAFVDPIRQSLVPVLVPKADLMNAVALNSAGVQHDKVSSAPFAWRLLIVAFGASGNFFVQGAAYGWYYYRLSDGRSTTPARRGRTSPLATSQGRA